MTAETNIIDVGMKQSPLERIRNTITSPFSKKKGSVGMKTPDDDENSNVPTLKTTSWDEMSSVASGVSSSTTASKLSKSKKRALRRQRAKQNRKVLRNEQGQDSTATLATEAVSIRSVPSVDESTTAKKKKKNKKNKKQTDLAKKDNAAAADVTGADAYAYAAPGAAALSPNKPAKKYIIRNKTLYVIDISKIVGAVGHDESSSLSVSGNKNTAAAVAMDDITDHQVSSVIDVYTDNDADDEAVVVFGKSSSIKKENCECDACVIS
jgi:hypothetical protein